MERLKMSLWAHKSRGLILAACALSLLLTTGSAQAVTKTWNNAAGGSWTTAANWTPSGVPLLGDDVVIPDIGGATYSVTYSVSSPVTLNSLSIGDAASGSQTLRVTAGAVTLNVGAGGTTVNSQGVLFQQGGTVTGTGTVSVNGTYRWSSGTLSTGAATINAAGTLTIDGSTKNLQTNLTNNGTTATISAGGINVTSGNTLANGGTLALTTTGAIARSGVAAANITNSGTLNYNTTGTFTNMTVSNSGTLNLNGGTLTVSGGSFTQTAGSTNLLGGNLSLGVTLTLSGGNLTGAGTISGSVNNTGGIVSPGSSAGLLNVTNFTQGAGGTLNIEIGGTTAGTQYDQLAVSTVATLGGTINFSLINAFVPVAGDVFSPLTYNSRTGTFSNLAQNAGVNVANGVCLSANYAATSLNLTTAILAAAVTTPSNGAFVNSPARLRGTATRDSGGGPLGTGIASVAVRVVRVSDGFFWNGTAFQVGSATISTTFDAPSGTWGTNGGPGTTAVTDGASYTITAIATATDGCTHTSSVVMVQVDKTVPTITITNGPANGSTVATLNDPLTGTAADTNGVNPSGLAQVRMRLLRNSDSMYWNGAAWQAGFVLVTATGTAAWSVTPLPPPGNNAATELTDGSYSLVMSVVDNAGNIGSATRSFSVDNTAPSAPVITKIGNVSNPMGGETVTSLTPIQGTATDNIKVASVMLEIVRVSDGKFWNGSDWQVGATTISTSFQPLVGTWARNSGLPANSKLVNGDYAITAIATDKTGNFSFTSVTVTVGP